MMMNRREESEEKRWKSDEYQWVLYMAMDIMGLGLYPLRRLKKALNSIHPLNCALNLLNFKIKYGI
jgi:hypothetical protein